MQDATHLKLAINRNHVQPMFVQPRAQQTANYPCTTALDAAGQPITDEAGSRFTQDYADSVHALP